MRINEKIKKVINIKNLPSKIFLKVIFFIEFKALSDKKSKGKKTTFKKKTKKIMFKVS